MRKLLRLSYQRTIPILFIALAIVLGVYLLGCNGSGKGKYTSEKKGIASIVVETNKDGNVSRFTLNQDRSTSTDQNVETQLPPNAKEGSNITMTDEGMAFGFGSSYEVKAIDWTKKNQQIYNYAAIACILLGVAMFFVPALAPFRAMALPLLGVGLFLMYVPTIIDRTGPIVAFAVIAGLLGMGALWIISRQRGKTEGKTEIINNANVAAAQLNAKGMTDVSTALRRVIDPKYNAAYKSTKTARAVQQADAGDPLAGVTPSAVVVPIVPTPGDQKIVAAEQQAK